MLCLPYNQSCTPRTNTAEKKTVEKMLSVPRTAVAYNYGASSDDVQVELVGVTITHSIQHVSNNPYIYIYMLVCS